MASYSSLRSSNGFKNRLNIIKDIYAHNANKFCENTSLHGLKYLPDKEVHLWEKFYFACTFITVVLLAFYFSGRVIDKWSNSPVIIGINPKPTLITQVPFPAVTVCNLNQAQKSRADLYPDSSVEHAMLEMLCRREANGSVANTINDWSNLKNFIGYIGQPCESMLLSCRFGAQSYNCSEIFRPVVADEGICCSFNMVHPSYMYDIKAPLEDNVTVLAGYHPVSWSAESGYQKDLPPKYYPRPAVGVGETLGLTLTLDVEADEYYCSSSNSIGFKILLHSPTELPSLREIGLLLSPGRETKMRIRAEQVESEQYLRSVNKRYRNCLFEDEENLNLFTHYSQRNCELECIAEMLQANCKCISYFMPRYFGNESTCSIYDSSCVERTRIASMLNDYKNSSCSKFCYPSCYDINYLPDMFSTPLTHSGFQISNQHIKNMSSSYVEQNIAVVHLYFKDSSYRSSKQTEFFGVTDVLSSIGGLIGVFCGFSFISLAEIIFFAVIRPFRAERQAETPNENIILVNGITNNQLKALKFTRRQYRHELGFNNNEPSNVKAPNIRELYMPNEFYKKASGTDKWALPASTRQ